MTAFNTPFPKANFTKFVQFQFVISAIIAFILAVFQPFGTESYSHPYKVWILMGYGLVTFVTGCIYYLILDRLLSERIKDRWTIWYEVVNLFFTILICQSACFLYWAWLYEARLSLALFFNFLILASMISVLPIGFYLLYIYIKYREVKYAYSIQMNQESSANQPISEVLQQEETSEKTLEIIGTGRREKFSFPSSMVRLIKAEDNYVILYCIEENGSPKKWMIRVTMNEIEHQLNSSFLRVHRSYIINKNHIEKLWGNVTNSRIKLKDFDEEIPVSRAKVAEIRQL